MKVRKTDKGEDKREWTRENSSNYFLFLAKETKNKNKLTFIVCSFPPADNYNDDTYN